MKREPIDPAGLCVLFAVLLVAGLSIVVSVYAVCFGHGPAWLRYGIGGVIGLYGLFVLGGAAWVLCETVWRKDGAP